MSKIFTQLPEELFDHILWKESKKNKDWRWVLIAVLRRAAYVNQPDLMKGQCRISIRQLAEEAEVTKKQAEKALRFWLGTTAQNKKRVDAACVLRESFGGQKRGQEKGQKRGQEKQVYDILLDGFYENEGTEKGTRKGTEKGMGEGTARGQQGDSLPGKTGTHTKSLEAIEKTTTSADAHDADFSFDPVKARAMLEEFWKSCDQKQSQIDNYLKKGIGHCFAALRHVTDPSFTVNTTDIQAFVWAFKTKPWLEKANQPKPMSNRERIEQNFSDGEAYNKAICTINASAISFHRGMKMGGANFEDKTFMSNFSKVLEEFGIENPFKIKLDNVKEA